MQLKRSATNHDLQALRGITALMVFVSHISGIWPKAGSNYRHFINLFTNWGTEAVVMFFILSGLVIHMSYDRVQRNAIDFLKNRMIRIHPTLILAVTFAFVLEKYTFKVNIGLIDYIGNIVPVATIHGYLVYILWNSNPPVWSLTYEVFFYLFFAIFCLKGKKIKEYIIWIWLVISICCIFIDPFYSPTNRLLLHILLVTSFSGAWIIGFFIWKYRYAFFCNQYLAVFSLAALPLVSRLHLLPNYYDPLKYTIFALMSWPFFQYLCIRRGPAGKKDNNMFVAILISLTYLLSIYWIMMDNAYALPIKLMYIVLPVLVLLAFYLFRQTAISGYKLILPALNYLGTISYSLYLFHFPVIVLITSLLNIHPIEQAIIIIIVLALITYLVDIKLQPAINRRVK